MTSLSKQNKKFYKPIVFKNIFANWRIDKSKFPILSQSQSDDVGTTSDFTQRFRYDRKLNNVLCESLGINKLSKVLGRYRTIGSKLDFHTDGHAITDYNHSLGNTRTHECKGKLNFLVHSITNENYLLFLNYFLGENIQWSRIHEGKFVNGNNEEPCYAIQTNLPVENKILMLENINKGNPITDHLLLHAFQSMLDYDINDGILFNPNQYHASGELLTGKDVQRKFVEFFIY